MALLILLFGDHGRRGRINCLVRTLFSYLFNGANVRVNPLMIFTIDHILRVFHNVECQTTIRRFGPGFNILFFIIYNFFGGVYCLGGTILFDLEHVVDMLVSHL